MFLFHYVNGYRNTIIIIPHYIIAQAIVHEGKLVLCIGYVHVHLNSIGKIYQ